MKREFKDLIRFEQYECLNSEIKAQHKMKELAPRVVSRKI